MKILESLTDEQFKELVVFITFIVSLIVPTIIYGITDYISGVINKKRRKRR